MFPVRSAVYANLHSNSEYFVEQQQRELCLSVLPNKSSVDDGYSCLKRCDPRNVACISNHTKEVLYQFRAIPTLRYIREPIEVSRISAQLDIPFSVDYRIDRKNREKFLVEQDRNVGIVKLKVPVTGPSTEIVRLHINTYSRTHVLLAHNVALIHIYISRFTF